MRSGKRRGGGADRRVRRRGTMSDFACATAGRCDDGDGAQAHARPPAMMGLRRTPKKGTEGRPPPGYRARVDEAKKRFWGRMCAWWRGWSGCPGYGAEVALHKRHAGALPSRTSVPVPMAMPTSARRGRGVVGCRLRAIATTVAVARSLSTCSLLACARPWIPRRRCEGSRAQPLRRCPGCRRRAMTMRSPSGGRSRIASDVA